MKHHLPIIFALFTMAVLQLDEIRCSAQGLTKPQVDPINVEKVVQPLLKGAPDDAATAKDTKPAIGKVKPLTLPTTQSKKNKPYPSGYLLYDAVKLKSLIISMTLEQDATNKYAYWDTAVTILKSSYGFKDADLLENLKTNCFLKKYFLTADGEPMVPTTPTITQQQKQEIIIELVNQVKNLHLITTNSLDDRAMMNFAEKGVTNQSLSQDPFYSSLNSDQKISVEPFIQHSKAKLYAAPSATPSVVNGAISGIGGLNVTEVADGAARFLVNRTKQEMSIFFFKEFKLKLKEQKDLQVLFPKTNALLQAIDDDIYDFNNYIKSLAEAFKADLKMLDQNIPALIPNHQDLFDRLPELKWVVIEGSYVVKSLRKNVHPGDLLDNFPLPDLSEKSSPFEKNLTASVQTLQILSYSLRAKPDSQGKTTSFWAPISDLKAVTSDEQTLQIFLGLVYSKMPSLKFYSGDQVIDLKDRINMIDIKPYSDDVRKYKQFIFELGSKAIDLEGSLDSTKKQISAKDTSGKPILSDSAKVELYCNFFSSTFDFIRYISSVATLPGLENIKQPMKKVDSVLHTGEGFLELTKSLNRRNYSQAVNEALLLYQALFTERIVKASAKIRILNSISSQQAKNKIEIEKSEATMAKKTQLAKNQDSLATQFESTKVELIKLVPELTDSGKFTDFIAAVTKELDNLDQRNATISGIARFGAFMASMASAKNSQDVETAIEAVALPPGSSLTKRVTRSSVSLNAYTGLFGAYEFYYGNRNLFVTGVTATIGIAFNWGNKKFFCGTGKSSKSIFVSIFDIGALASYRFTNDDKVLQPKIQLKDIVSPGIFYSYGLANAPVSINVGYQLAPHLSVIDASGATVNVNNIGRVSVSVVVDIPLLNLSVRKNKPAL